MLAVLQSGITYREPPRAFKTQIHKSHPKKNAVTGNKNVFKSLISQRISLYTILSVINQYDVRAVVFLFSLRLATAAVKVLTSVIKRQLYNWCKCSEGEEHIRISFPLKNQQAQLQSGGEFKLQHLRTQTKKQKGFISFLVHTGCAGQYIAIIIIRSGGCFSTFNRSLLPLNSEHPEPCAQHSLLSLLRSLVGLWCVKKHRHLINTLWAELYCIWKEIKCSVWLWGRRLSHLEPWTATLHFVAFNYYTTEVQSFVPL